MNIDDLIAQPLPSIERQQDNLLRWAERELGDDQMGVLGLPSDNDLAGILGAVNGDQAMELVELTEKDELIAVEPGDSIVVRPRGWKRLEDLRKPSGAESESSIRPVDPQEAVLAHCNKCGGDRRAVVRASYEAVQSDDEVRWSDRYDVLQCRGCETIFVRHLHWFSEHDWIDQDAQGNPRLNPGITTKYWPPAVTRPKPSWAKKITDPQLLTVMDEVYAALASGLVVLATTGARTLFDRTSTLQVGDLQGGFQAKLNQLEADGHISGADKKMLEAMTDAGNASAHRGFAPTIEQLNGIMGIIENYMERVLVLSEAAEELRRATPTRKQRPKPKA